MSNGSLCDEKPGPGAEIAAEAKADFATKNQHENVVEPLGDGREEKAGGREVKADVFGGLCHYEYENWKHVLLMSWVDR